MGPTKDPLAGSAEIAIFRSLRPRTRGLRRGRWSTAAWALRPSGLPRPSFGAPQSHTKSSVLPMPLQIYAGGYSLAVDVWVRPQTFMNCWQRQFRSRSFISTLILSSVATCFAAGGRRCDDFYSSDWRQGPTRASRKFLALSC